LKASFNHRKKGHNELYLFYLHSAIIHHHDHSPTTLRNPRFHLWYGKLQPDVIALNCGLSACATAQRWEEALKLGRTVGLGGLGGVGGASKSQDPS